MCAHDRTPTSKPKVSLTSTELASHNTLKSALVSIRDKLYDLTDFIDHHPGGRDILLLSLGRDVTTVFETYHDEKVLAVLKKYYVGDLLDKPLLPTFPLPSPFQKTLRSRIKHHFTSTNQDPKFHPMHLVHYFLIALFIFTSYYVQFFYAPIRDSVVLSTIAAVALGFGCAESCFSIVHDGSHASFSHKSWVWLALGAWHDFINGASSVAWFYQHVLGHHPYTNLPDADPDIHVAKHHFRRIRTDQRWHPIYLLQHIYAPILYSLYGLKSRYDDINILYFTKSRGSIPVNQLATHQHLVFWLGKAFFVFHRLILPSFFLPFSKVLWLFFVADVVTAWTLALVFQANHVVQHVDWPLPDKETNIVSQDWMEMQIRTAQDYSHDSFWTTKLTGALNYQVVHHAVPAVCQWYYPEIAPIVKECCKEFGVEYVVRKNFWEAIGDHVDLLWVFGRDERPVVGGGKKVN